MKKELEELLKLSHKRNFNLQLFADDGGEGGSGGDDPEDKPDDDGKEVLCGHAHAQEFSR